MAKVTPLYSTLLSEAEKDNLRMHMPGHKGKLPGDFQGTNLYQIDFTELASTGNLYKGLPPIYNAEQLMAAATEARECFFLTGGSTQGIMAAMAVACPLSSHLLIDRGSHCSVWNAMAHLDLNPSYLYSDILMPWNIVGSITEKDVDKALRSFPLPSAVLITSPTYYGVLSDVAGIARVTSKYHVPLLVDEAHGAHLLFLDGYKGAVAQGAALSVTSAHKTLPALTPGALLLSDARYCAKDVRRKAAMFGTSSPSYLVMASMDVARAYMQEKGAYLYGQAAEFIRDLRKEINERGVFLALEEKDGLRLDPTRLVVHTTKGGISGYDAAKILEKQFHIVCEMADMQNIVFIITCSDSFNDLSHLREAILSMEEFAKPDAATVHHRPIAPPPTQKMSPREAAFAQLEYVPLKNAAGNIAGEHIALYPPGIPLVAAGEEIDEQQISYLQDCQFDMEREIAIISMYDK